MKRDMQYLIVVLLFIFIAGCASTLASLSGNAQKDPDFTVTITTRYTVPPVMAWAYVSFKGTDYLIAEEKQKASLELRDPELKYIPKVGYLIIQYNGLSIETATGENWTYIILDSSGEEVSRGIGDTDIPNYSTSEYGTRWYSFDIVPINKSVDFPLRLRTVNTFFPEQYSEFSIARTQ